ncbi:MAG: DUF4432 family protein [Planctomycetales bacterium]|nr:DUF4432 family protein [Planctomycetales bacterium]NIM07924.1 DUF4432 family protein [Planctomycetales bacterium]NIN07411.1 DUF4432 family protein [Planctomycetales bacterium]NIN76515.1 DUF4432 family protein [Planctomycetales bacterium]NIO33705.1 DUF4432 family protein [Planctomycetales bacterium]
MAARCWTLIDTSENQAAESLVLEGATLGPAEGARIELQTLRGGLQEGVRMLTIDNGALRLGLLPDRGMGLWKAWHGATEIGWQSPVRGPVHPRHVPVMEPNGLGWLYGFDELLVRCGLLSNGAPDFDPQGTLTYPLHGLIANRPAHLLQVAVDDQSGEISATGVVEETRFHFHKLRLTSTLKTRSNSLVMEIHDQITNFSGKGGEAQMLYHVNFGPPLNTPGATLIAPVRELVPRDEHAASSVAQWNTYGPTEVAAQERVYFSKLLADEKGSTQVLLRAAHRDQGVSLRFNTRQLPCFTQWKNNPPLPDGYVTGLEPGTNFPNPRGFETQQGRVLKLAAGETAEFKLAIQLHPDAGSVAEAEAKIATLQSAAQPIIHNSPHPDWCA